MQMFHDVPQARRERAIRLLEDSLFHHRVRALDDVPPTLPGFDVSQRETTPYYRVQINPRLLKV